MEYGAEDQDGTLDFIGGGDTFPAVKGGAILEVEEGMGLEVEDGSHMLSEVLSCQIGYRGGSGTGNFIEQESTIGRERNTGEEKGGKPVIEEELPTIGNIIEEGNSSIKDQQPVHRHGCAQHDW